MNPPYNITPTILKLVTSISEKIGEVNATFLDKPTTLLRKKIKIKTIHSSLQIEGNTLTEEQITAILEDKKVVGPKKDINEVHNAIKIYDNLNLYDSNNEKSFLKAHKNLMSNLIPDAGKYRQKGVGIVKGSKLEHLPPPHKNVPYLMKDLFKYLNKSDEIELIKSCVFHYELEFIHPFIDGNGRMGRLWQSLIIMRKYPVFEYLPFETLISKTQKQYYKALSDSDKKGNSTIFIEYMLNVIDSSLGELLKFNTKPLKSSDRLEYFLSTSTTRFTRKDYMNVFKTISSSTATRDLLKGVEKKLLKKAGDNNQTVYLILRGTT